MMTIKRTCAQRLRWLKSDLLLWRGDHVSAVAIERVPTNCFGALGEREQLALEKASLPDIDHREQRAPA